MHRALNSSSMTSRFIHQTFETHSGTENLDLWIEAIEKIRSEATAPALLLDRVEEINERQILAKRIFDLAVCALLMPILLPIMIIVALAVKLDSKGGLIFSQTRIGRHGKPFTCYKFRSMCVDAEALKAKLAAENESDGPVFKMKHDPRITRVGCIIRKLSLDELPQMLNVLKGDMSLVGPRPAVPSEVIEYTPHQMQRLAATPGLTGLQQVSGRSSLSFDKWIEFDLQYCREQSVAKDIEILLRTIPAVLTADGAY